MPTQSNSALRSVYAIGVYCKTLCRTLIIIKVMCACTVMFKKYWTFCFETCWRCQVRKCASSEWDLIVLSLPCLLMSEVVLGVHSFLLGLCRWRPADEEQKTLFLVISQARSPGHPVAGESHLQAALTEGPTSGSGSNIPFARDFFCVWLSLSSWRQPLLKYKLSNRSRSLCPSLRDPLCCRCHCSGSRRRISFSVDFFSVNFASAPNWVETMNVHISRELEAVRRDALCRKHLLIKEKFTEQL